MFRKSETKETLKNLVSTLEVLETLKSQKWSTSWDNLEFLERRIKYYEDLVAKGVIYEPLF